jgi:hypothetical protein
MLGPPESPPYPMMVASVTLTPFLIPEASPLRCADKFTYLPLSALIDTKMP